MQPAMSDHPTANAPVPANSPAPKRRRRRIFLILGILALVLVLAAPWIVALTGLRDRTINAILASPSVTASSESASFGWFSPLSVHGLELTSTNKRVDIRVDDMAAERSPLRLLSTAPDLGTIRVSQPHVRLELPLDVEIKGPRHRLEPTVTAVATDAALTVRLVGQDEPVLDIDGVDLTARVEQTENGRVLTLDPLVVFDRRKLSGKLVKGLLYLFDPTIANAPQVSGEVSFSLDKLRIPLGVPKEEAIKRMEVEGRVTLHQVSSEVRNPLRMALVQLLADMNGKQVSDVVRLAQDSEIRFQVRDGRLHHEGLRIGFPEIDPGLVVASRGSVGLDKSLDLHVELPRLDKDKRKENGPARCHITGTIDRPRIAVEDASLVLRQPGRTEPIIAADGLTLAVQVEDTAAGPVLVVEPVEVFKKAKLSVVAANGLVSLIAPDVQAERQVGGEISLALTAVRIPLGGPKELGKRGLEVAGKLTLHQVATEVKKPLWQALVKLLADMNGKPPSDVVRLVDGAEIQFQLRDGRLHHEGLRIGFPEIDPELVVASRGSVGMDQSLDLYLEFPRLRKDKRVKGPVKCHVTGTLSEPKVSVPDASLVVQLTDTDKATLTVDDVNLTFGVEASKAGRMLTLAPVTLFDKRKVTPEVGDQILKLIAPTLSELSGVQGEITLSFDTFRVPLGVPKSEAVKRVDLAGKLILHQITVSTKTPLVQTTVKLLADMYGKQPSDLVRIVENSEVRFQVRDGRMHHEGLRIGFPDISADLIVSSRGSVGYDTSLDLVLEIPRILLDKKELAIRKGPAPVRFQVTGTIEKPVVTEIKEVKDK
jgi:hypothetical protein